MKKLLLFPCLYLVFGNIAMASENPYLQLKSRDCRQNLITLKPGNTLPNIPELPAFTIGRVAVFDHTVLRNAQDEESTRQVVQYARKKIPGVLSALRAKGLLSEINRVAKIYGVDPLQVLAPILGEKVFNGFIDAALQDSVSNFLKSDLDRIGGDIRKLGEKPEVQACMRSSISNYWKWQCAVFYNADEVGNPLLVKVKKAGTCGIAQFNPVLLWSLNDVVVRVGHQEPIVFGDIKKSLDVVLTPQKILHYLAAYALVARQVYLDVACVDISKNAGIVASLYNLGGEYTRAYYLSRARAEFPAENRRPQENYFGWFINYFEGDLRKELQKEL
ncbi:MAG: DUF1402 family protein [Bdellovibrionales bacterium]|nr:DUF1402 family protein [Bdellovibrionales bacterium]